MTRTAVATAAPIPEPFQPKDTYLYLQVGTVPVFWLSKRDQGNYKKWKGT